MSAMLSSSVDDSCFKDERGRGEFDRSLPIGVGVDCNAVGAGRDPHAFGAEEGFMKTHFAWRPHLDRDSLFNPFIPSERQSTMGHVELSEAYGDDTQTAAETMDSGPEPLMAAEPAAPADDLAPTASGPMEDTE